jgi:hypothetical protein
MKRLLFITSLFLFPIALRAGEKIDFQKQIAPLFREQCLNCHSGSKPKGALDLTQAKNLPEVITPGKSEKSRLFEVVLEGKMPPKKPLNPEQIALLKRWIDSGATWNGGDLVPVQIAKDERAGKDWWSLQPIRQPQLPYVKDLDWVRNPIDRFVRAKQEEKGISPSPSVDRRTYIRRVTLDLIGLLPTPEEVDAYLADRSPNADEKLVDRLLDSPLYGETWARHWLDVVRFAESHGFETNQLRPNAWHYRDYLIRSFNDDLPFGDFVRHQLAGDLEPNGDLLTRGATGFLVAGPHDLVGDAIPEAEMQKRSNDLFDMVSTTSTTFLGLTVGCARCHDHKFDPISQKDFYSFEAVFAGVEHAEVPVPASRMPNRDAAIRELRSKIARLEIQLGENEPLAESKNQPSARRTPVNSGRNIERITPQRVKFVRFTTLETNDGTEPCLDELELFSPGPEEGNLALASKGVKATASSEYPNANIHKIAHINDGLYGNSHSWISREPGKGWIQLELKDAHDINRLVWARDREGKFTDRTPTNYRIEGSLNGTDWFVLCGSWDRAKSLNEINPIPELRKILEALHLARDELARLGKPDLGKPETIYAGRFRKPDATYLLKRGDISQRGEVISPGSLEAVSLAMPKRTISTTPLQALNLFNDEFMLDQADRFARRIRQEVGDDPLKQIEQAFRLALLRSPTPREKQAAMKLVEEHTLANLCRAILNCNELVMQE